MELRVGQGVDLHQFVEGRALKLGGVEIPHHSGLAGHSDADALLHAVTDAVLGAAGKPDIGTHFPDSDPNYKDADSAVLFQRVWKKLQGEGWRLVNLDATVLCEEPKLGPHREAIIDSIAKLFESERSRVSLKATTCEKMGALGRKEGLMALSVVLLERSSE